MACRLPGLKRTRVLASSDTSHRRHFLVSIGHIRGASPVSCPPCRRTSLDTTKYRTSLLIVPSPTMIRFCNSSVTPLARAAWLRPVGFGNYPQPRRLSGSCLAIETHETHCIHSLQHRWLQFAPVPDCMTGQETGRRLLRSLQCSQRPVRGHNLPKWEQGKPGGDSSLWPMRASLTRMGDLCKVELLVGKGRSAEGTEARTNVRTAFPGIHPAWPWP